MDQVRSLGMQGQVNVLSAWSEPSAIGRLDLGRVARWLRWLAVCWIVVFWRSGGLSLLDPDESALRRVNSRK